MESQNLSSHTDFAFYPRARNARSVPGKCGVGWDLERVGAAEDVAREERQRDGHTPAGETPRAGCVESLSATEQVHGNR
eukprot:1394154-Rhodomonas_salina.3